MQLTPIIVLLGGLILFKESFSRLQWVGFGVLILGIGLFFNQRYAELLFVVEDYGGGVWLVIAAAVLWGIFMLVQKRLLRHLPSTSIMALVNWFGILLFLPLARPSRILDLAPLPILLLACAAVFALVSYLSFGEALKRLEASRMGALVSLTPLITIASTGLLALFGPQPGPHGTPQQTRLRRRPIGGPSDRCAATWARAPPNRPERGRKSELGRRPSPKERR